MALQNFVGFETNTFDEVTSGSGGSFSNTRARSGTYALNVTSSGNWYNVMPVSATTKQIISNASYNSAVGGVGFYCAALPNASSILCGFQSSNTTDLVRVRLETDGKLSLIDNAGTVTTSANAVISAGEWFYLDLKFTTSSTAELRVTKDSDGSQVTAVSVSSGLYTQGLGAAWFSVTVSTAATGFDFWFDDIYFGDGTSYYGPLKVVRLPLTGNGSTMVFTTSEAGVNTGDYTKVNKASISDGTYIQCLTTAGEKAALFDLTDSATASVSGTIKGVKGWVRARESTSVTSAVKLRWRGGDSTNLDIPGTALNIGTSFVSYWDVQEVDPATSVAFTTGGLDALEFGCINTASNAIRASIVWVSVAFTPSTGFTGTGASTIGSTTQSASGTETYTGTASSTTAGTQQSGTGYNFIGTAASVVGATQQSASGTETFTGTAGSTTGAVQQSAEGTQALGFTGTAASVVGATQQSAEGTTEAPAAITGTAASTIRAVIQAAAGFEGVEATAESVIGAVTQEAEGAQYDNLGDAASVIGAITQEASGQESITGTAASLIGYRPTFIYVMGDR